MDFEHYLRLARAEPFSDEEPERRLAWGVYAKQDVSWGDLPLFFFMTE